MKKLRYLLIILLLFVSFVLIKQFNYNKESIIPYNTLVNTNTTTLNISLSNGTFSNGNSTQSFTFNSDFKKVSANTLGFDTNKNGSFEMFDVSCSIKSDNEYFDGKYIATRSFFNSSNQSGTDTILEVSHKISDGTFNVSLSDANNSFGSSTINCTIDLNLANTGEETLSILLVDGTYLGLTGNENTNLTSNGILIFKEKAESGIQVEPKPGYTFDLANSMCTSGTMMEDLGNNKIKFNNFTQGDTCIIKFSLKDYYYTLDVHEAGKLIIESLVGSDFQESIFKSNYNIPGNGDSGRCYNVGVDLNEGVIKDKITVQKNNIDDSNFRFECSGQSCSIHACYSDPAKDSSVILKYEEEDEDEEESPGTTINVSDPSSPSEPILNISENIGDSQGTTLDELDCENERVLVIDRVAPYSQKHNINYNLNVKVSNATKTVEIKNVSSLSTSDLPILEEICNKNVASGKKVSGSLLSDILSMPTLSDVYINSDITTCGSLISTISSSLTNLSIDSSINKQYNVSNNLISLAIKYNYLSNGINKYIMKKNDKNIAMLFVGYTFEYTMNNCGNCFDDERLNPSSATFNEENFKDKCCVSNDERLTNEVKENYCPVAVCNLTPELNPHNDSFNEEKYKTTCCNVINQSSDAYKTYCNKTSYDYKMPMCGIEDEENKGHIYEAKEKGITSTNYEEVLNGVDYENKSYVTVSNDYCKVACKEDVEFYFPGFAVNGQDESLPTSKFWIRAGQYFKFTNIDKYQTPTVIQKKTCIQEFNLDKVAEDLYGEGSYFEDDFVIGDVKKGLFYKYALANAKYQLELKAFEYEYNQIDTIIIKNNKMFYNGTYIDDDYKIKLSYEIAINLDDKSIDEIKRYDCNYNTGRCTKTYLKNDEFIVQEQQNILNQIATEISNFTTSISKCDLNYDATYSTTINISDYTYTDKEKNVSNSKAIDDIKLIPNIIQDGKTITKTYCNSDYSNCTSEEKDNTINIEWPGHNNEFMELSIQNMKTEATQEVSFVMNEDLYTLIPSGSITSLSAHPNFSSTSTRRILLGKVFPVDVSTRATTLVYSFKINGIGDKGRLDDFYLTKYNDYSNNIVDTPKYICNYVVANVITCPIAMNDDNKTSILTSVNNRTIASTKKSTCLIDPDCKFVKQDNSYIVTCLDSYDENDQINMERGELAISVKRVDLSNLFPNNRVIGSNWTNDIGQAALLEIQNNGKGNDVYNNDPMYSITLDTTKIKEIREYNENHDYNDFELDCIENEGTECWSKFLTDYFPESVSTARSKWKYYDENLNRFVEITKR